jgi:putative ABC transport system permease protein
VGVKQRQVMWLFTLEALVVGVLGGLAGAIIGRTALYALAAKGIRIELAGTSAASILRPAVSPEFVVGAVVVAIIGALVASAYPAWRASRLNPVDALRST